MVANYFTKWDDPASGASQPPNIFMQNNRTYPSHPKYQLPFTPPEAKTNGLFRASTKTPPNPQYLEDSGRLHLEKSLQNFKNSSPKHRWPPPTLPKNPDPSKLAILRALTPAIQVQTLPLEGPRILRAVQKTYPKKTPPPHCATSLRSMQLRILGR